MRGAQVTSCLTLLLASIEHSLGLTPDTQRLSNVYARPQGWKGKSGQEASGWSLEKLKANATARRTLERVTRCDNTLFADALRRLPPRPEGYTNASCTRPPASWLAEHADL